jgi:hypothetical protein
MPMPATSRLCWTCSVVGTRDRAEAVVRWSAGGKAWHLAKSSNAPKAIGLSGWRCEPCMAKRG